MTIKSYGYLPGAWEYFNYLLSSRDPSKPNYFKPTPEYENIPLSTKLILAAYFTTSLFIVYLLVDLVGFTIRGNGTAKIEFIGLLFIMFFGLILISNRRLKKEARTRSNKCRNCEYSLEGHESVGTVLYLKHRLETGPLKCPECGTKYPRIF